MSGKKTKNKKKKGSKNKAGKSAASKGRGQGNSAMVSGIRKAIGEYACSLADPWGCAACVPDGARSVGCFSIKQQFTLSTGTGSCNAIFIQPNTNGWSYVDTGSTAATPTVAGNWTAGVNANSMASLYGKWRPVSGGMRCTYIGNTQTDGGMLVFGQVSAGVAPTSFNGLSLTQACSLFQNYKTCPLRNGCKVIWLPESETEAEQWNQIYGTATTIATSTLASFPWIAVILYSANASQATFCAEAVFNFQGQFTSQTFMPGGLSDASGDRIAAPGWYASARNLIQHIPQAAPMIGAVGQAAYSAYTGGWKTGLMSLANGLFAPGLTGGTGLPRLGGGKRLLLTN